MADVPADDVSRLEHRIIRLEEDHARLVSAVDAHADLLRAIGALTEVLGVSAGGASPDEPGPGTPPGPPPVAAR
jgi:hypothetical protein